MRVFRIAIERHAYQLSSSGRANRWNKAGQYVIYTSSSISLCALELLAHTNGTRPAGNFKIMHIEIANSPEIHQVDKLADQWYRLSGYSKTQQVGHEWYTGEKTLVMKVPSAIISLEYNYIINTRHPDFKSSVNLFEVTDFFWDSRFSSG